METTARPHGRDPQPEPVPAIDQLFDGAADPDPRPAVPDPDPRPAVPDPAIESHPQEARNA